MIRRFLVVLALLSGVGVALAGPASAHAVLVGSSPTDGQRVNAEPATVTLTFDESVGLIAGAEEVISSAGSRVSGTPHAADGGRSIVLPLRPGLPAGSYSATWRVVSADTHIVSGSITFGLRVDPSALAATPPDHTHALDAAADVAQGLVYAGIVGLAGLLAVLLGLWPTLVRGRRTSLVIISGWVLVAVGTLGALWLQGPRAANGSWSSAFRLTGLGHTVDTTFGRQLLARLALLVVLVPVVLLVRRQPRLPAARLAGIVGGLALAASVIVTGHQSVGGEVGLAFVAGVLHVTAMAVWLGGLIALLVLVLPGVRAGALEGPDAGLRAWSVTAYVCVAVLAVTGEIQAARQLTPLAALWSTRYGVVLLIKLGLIAVLLVGARLGQRRISRASAPSGPGPAAAAVAPASAPPEPVRVAPASSPGASRAAAVRAAVAAPPVVVAPVPSFSLPDARALGRSVRLEAVIAVLVLAVTAVLVSEAPGRTTYGPATTLNAPLGPDSVAVHVSTTKRGPEILTVAARDGAGRPVGLQSVTASLSTATVPSLDVRFRRVGDAWRSTTAAVPLPGVWTLDLDIAVTGSEAYATSATYRVW